MKILIFENEFVYLDVTFQYVNELYFDKELSYEVYASSQEFKSFNIIDEYDAVIIDISLSLKSELDGYGLLKKLNELNFDKKKVIIMTGNHQIKEILKDKDIEFQYSILTKPIDIFDLKKALKSIK
jgi:CheY-like chemotaxis protein